MCFFQKLRDIRLLHGRIQPGSPQNGEWRQEVPHPGSSGIPGYWRAAKEPADVPKDPHLHRRHQDPEGTCRPGPVSYDASCTRLVYLWWTQNPFCFVFFTRQIYLHCWLGWPPRCAWVLRHLDSGQWRMTLEDLRLLETCTHSSLVSFMANHRRAHTKRFSHCIESENGSCEITQWLCVIEQNPFVGWEPISASISAHKIGLVIAEL